eukprot:2303650-Amphidinium_carterae.1
MPDMGVATLHGTPDPDQLTSSKGPRQCWQLSTSETYLAIYRTIPTVHPQHREPRDPLQNQYG